MARTDYTGVPDASARVEAPDDYQHVEASPEAFGAPIAAGLKELGAGAEVAQKFYGQVAADNATNNTMDRVSKILYGDPSKTTIGPDGKPVPDTGYFGLRGADAMSKRQEVSQDIDNAIQENRGGLFSAESQEQYDVDTRRMRNNWAIDMGKHADEQQRVWSVDTNNTTAGLALNTLGKKPNDPDTIQQTTDAVRKAYVRNAQLNGEDPAGALTKADQEVTLARIHAQIVSNPQGAQQVFDTDGGVLASRADYDQIARSVKEATINSQMAPAIDRAVGDAKVRAQQSVQGGGPNPNNIGNVKNAGGAGFAQPATPTDGVVLAANTLRSGYRGLTVEQIANKWAPASDNNNPAQWAQNVSKASGIAANAVPNLDDPKTLESLISGIGAAEKKAGDRAAFTPDIIASGVGHALGGGAPKLAQGAAGPQYPSTADALNATMETTLDKAQKDAEELFPNYPDAQERYVEGVRRRLDQTIAQQHQQYEVDTHIVQAALAGPNPPISEEQLKASSPQVAAAWSSVQVNASYAAMGVERMFDANAKGRALGYGSQFKDYLDRVLAPQGNADRITSASQLWPYAGTDQDSVLTNTGINELGSLLEMRGTPQGEAQAAQIKRFIDTMHGNLTFSNQVTGIYDKKGEQAFGKFVAQALPVLKNAYDQGTIGKVLDPNSPDYLGKLAQTFMRKPEDVMKDRVEDTPLLPAGMKFAAIPVPRLEQELDALDNDAQRKEALKYVVAQGQVSKDDGAKIAAARGWIRRPAAAPPAPPEVPRPD